MEKNGYWSSNNSRIEKEKFLTLPVYKKRKSRKKNKIEMIKEALKVIENLNTKENTHNIRGCTSTCFIISVLYTIKLYYIRDVYIDYVYLINTLIIPLSMYI